LQSILISAKISVRTLWKLYSGISTILSTKLTLLLHIVYIGVIIHHIIDAKITRGENLCNVNLKFVIVVWIDLLRRHLSWGLLNMFDSLRNRHSINMFLGDTNRAVTFVSLFDNCNLFTFYFRFGYWLISSVLLLLKALHIRSTDLHTLIQFWSTGYFLSQIWLDFGLIILKIGVDLQILNGHFFSCAAYWLWR